MPGVEALDKRDEVETEEAVEAVVVAEVEEGQHYFEKMEGEAEQRAW